MLLLCKEGIIRIDIPDLRLELLVDEDTDQRRKDGRSRAKIKTGYMKRYAQLVQSASTGAVFKNKPSVKPGNSGPGQARYCTLYARPDLINRQPQINLFIWEKYLPE